MLGRPGVQGSSIDIGHITLDSCRMGDASRRIQGGRHGSQSDKGKLSRGFVDSTQRVSERSLNSSQPRRCPVI